MSDRTTSNKYFTINVTRGDIQIAQLGKSASITFTPAEAEKISHLLTIALSLGPGAAKRPFIQGSPFRILFNNKGKDCVLIRKGQKAGEGLQFEMRQVDRLVQTIQTAVDVYVDGQILSPGAPAGVTARAFEVPEPPIEGRD